MTDENHDLCEEKWSTRPTFGRKGDSTAEGKRGGKIRCTLIKVEGTLKEGGGSDIRKEAVVIG